MELQQLTDREQLALVGLAKLIVHADQQLSDHEGLALANVARELGRDMWNARVEEARVSLPTADATYDLAESIERPEARQRILEVLKALAGSDEVIDAEADILRWLEQVWGFAAVHAPPVHESPVDPADDVGEAMVLFDEEE